MPNVNISGRDATELYTALDSPRSPWQCLESAYPYLLQFWRYRGKSGLGGILPPSCRDKGFLAVYHSIHNGPLGEMRCWVQEAQRHITVRPAV